MYLRRELFVVLSLGSILVMGLTLVVVYFIQRWRSKSTTSCCLSRRRKPRESRPVVGDDQVRINNTQNQLDSVRLGIIQKSML